MTKIFSVVFLCCVIHFSSAQTGENWFYNIDKSNLALNGFDAVSYFSDSGPVKGSIDFEAVYEDVKYQFSSKKNKNIFIKEPAKYIPQYGGWCAYRLGQKPEEEGWGQSRIPSDPEKFKIIENRLYVFSMAVGDAKVRWEAHEDSEMLERANAFWESRVELAKLSDGKPDGLNVNARMENLKWNKFMGKWDGKGHALASLDPVQYSDYPPATWTFSYGFDGYSIQDEWVPHSSMGGTWNGPSVRGYDPLKKEWVMTFLPINAGVSGIWIVTGNFNDKGEVEGFMESKDAQGRAYQQKIFFHKITDDYFEWRADRSYDGGKNWIEKFMYMEVSRIKD